MHVLQTVFLHKKNVFNGLRQSALALFSVAIINHNDWGVHLKKSHKIKEKRSRYKIGYLLKKKK